MLYFTTFDNISWRNINSILLWTPSWIFNFDEFFLRFAKFILHIRLLAQGDESLWISTTKLLRFLLTTALALYWLLWYWLLLHCYSTLESIFIHLIKVIQKKGPANWSRVLGYTLRWFRFSLATVQCVIFFHECSSRTFTWHGKLRLNFGNQSWFKLTLNFKINKSCYIALFLVSGPIKRFSQLVVSIFIFS